MESEIRFFRNTGHSLLSRYISPFLSLLSFFFFEGKKKEKVEGREIDGIVISFINVDSLSLDRICNFVSISLSLPLLSFSFPSFIFSLSFLYFLYQNLNERSLKETSRGKRSSQETNRMKWEKKKDKQEREKRKKIEKEKRRRNFFLRRERKKKITYFTFSNQCDSMFVVFTAVSSFYFLLLSNFFTLFLFLLFLSNIFSFFLP